MEQIPSTPSTPFWLNEPTILFNKKYIASIWPSEKMSSAEKLNAISRFVIAASLLGYLITLNLKMILVAVVTLAVIAILYNVQRNQQAKNTSTDDDDGNGNGNGVSSDQIPPGQEDLYIRKTQMVPPICPACPKCPSVNCDDKCGNNKCPPCPACARCPEPQFECKKVPNYSSANIMGNLPIPWADKLDLH